MLQISRGLPSVLTNFFLYFSMLQSCCYGSNGILIFEGGEFYNRNKANGEFHLVPSINFENY